MKSRDTPDGWTAPAPRMVAAAKTLALAGLESPRLAEFYTASSNYAGITFAHLQPNEPSNIGAGDLHAVSLLAVSVGPRETRALLEQGKARSSVLDALKAVRPEWTLAGATSDQLVKAWKFNAAVKDAIADPAARASNPWVTAAKIAARKRPGLIPVRDNVVGKALGKAAWTDGRVYWLLFRALLKDNEVTAALDRTRSRLNNSTAPGVTIEVDTHDARLLDVAIWKILSDRAREQRAEGRRAAKQ